jgi:hypothetical protein
MLRLRTRRAAAAVLHYPGPWRPALCAAGQSLRTVARRTKNPDSARALPARLFPLEFTQCLARASATGSLTAADPNT